MELFNAGGSVKALGPKNIKCWNIVAGLIRIYDIYIIDRLDITFTVHMFKVFESIIFLEMIISDRPLELAPEKLLAV